MLKKIKRYVCEISCHVGTTKQSTFMSSENDWTKKSAYPSTPSPKILTIYIIHDKSLQRKKQTNRKKITLRRTSKHIIQTDNTQSRPSIKGKIKQKENQT